MPTKADGKRTISALTRFKRSMLETKSWATHRLGKTHTRLFVQQFRAAGDILYFCLAFHSNLSVLLSYSEITLWEFSHPSSFETVLLLFCPVLPSLSRYLCALVSEEGTCVSCGSHPPQPWSEAHLISGNDSNT